MTFKIGDRVRVSCDCDNPQLRAGEEYRVVSQYNRGSLKWVLLQDESARLFETHHILCLKLVTQGEKEPKMKIGQYEVEVISRDEVKVGCRMFDRDHVKHVQTILSRLSPPPFPEATLTIEGQQVTLADANAVLKLMDNFTERLVPSKLPPNKIAIGVGGPFVGDLFVRMRQNFVIKISQHIIGTAGLGASANIAYDTTTVRILTDEEIKRMLEAVKP